MRELRLHRIPSTDGWPPLAPRHLTLRDVSKHHMPQTWPRRPFQIDVRRSQRLAVANDAHGAEETLAPPPLSVAGTNGTLLDLAGDAVPVSIQLFAVARITPIQGSCSRRLRLLAVGIVRTLLLRLRSGSGGRRTTAGLSLLFWCRLGLWCWLRLLHERLQRRLRCRGLRRRTRRRRRRRTRSRGGTRSRRRRGSRSR